MNTPYSLNRIIIIIIIISGSVTRTIHELQGQRDPRVVHLTVIEYKS
jgi:hypothetical protein